MSHNSLAREFNRSEISNVGVPLSYVLNLVGVRPQAKYVVFFPFDESWDSLDMPDAWHPQTLLAYGMNGKELPSSRVRPTNQNRQNTPAVMFVWAETPLPEKVRRPLIGDPLRLDVITDGIVLRIMVGLPGGERMPVGDPSATFGLAPTCVVAVFLLRETRMSSLMP